MKKAYYYVAQSSYPRTEIRYFVSFGKKEIKKWFTDRFMGPDGLFINDPTSKPIEDVHYIDLTITD